MDLQGLNIRFGAITEAGVHSVKRKCRSLRFGTLSKVTEAFYCLVDETSQFKAILRPGYLTNEIRRIKKVCADSCLRVTDVSESEKEPAILSGYRPCNFTIKQSIVSLFGVNNETVNFWTHIFPSIYFLYMFYTFFTNIPLCSDSYYHPFVVYMFAASAYPLVSALAHGFSCVSINAVHVCFFVDYAALSVYAWGCSLIYYSYLFDSTLINSTYSLLYLPVAAILSVLSIFVTCCSRFLNNNSIAKKIRLLGFVVPYLWASPPLLYYLLNCNSGDVCNISKAFHTNQFISVLLASFFYGTHLPEILAPGKFDFAGNSHNLLHIFGSFATYEQMMGIFTDMEGRSEFLRNAEWTPHSLWIKAVTPAIVIINIGIVLYFKKMLKTLPDRNMIPSKKM